MVQHLPPLSIITAVFFLCGAPVHGQPSTTPWGQPIVTYYSPLTFWDWLEFGIALLATIFLGCLFIVSIQTFFMHLNKNPHHLFSQEPVGEARTGQLFCTLVVLSLSFLTAYFPLLMAFDILRRDKAGPGPIPIALTHMTIYLGNALAAGALLALVSYRRHLHFGREEGTLLWKKGLDFAIIGSMITFIAIWTPLAVHRSRFNRHSQVFDVKEAMKHLRVAFYYLAVLDIFVSAAFLWRKLKAAGKNDQAILNLCGASFFFISLAIFNIIEDVLTSVRPRFHINYAWLGFFDLLINGVCAFFGLAWVLRVYRSKLGFCCYGY